MAPRSGRQVAPNRCSVSQNEASVSSIGTSIIWPFAGAFAMVERAQHGDAEMEPRRLVGDQARHEFGRLAVDAALQRRGPAHALHQVVEGGLVAVRPLARVAERIGVDDRRIDLLQVLIAQPQPLDRRRPAVMDEEVGVLDQVLQDGDGRGLLEIEAERALVAVGRHVDRAHALVAAHRAARHAQQVAFRRLDLDHVGAHVGQMLGGERPQQHGRQVDHFHARKRSRHCRSLTQLSAQTRRRFLLVPTAPARRSGW